MAGDLKFQLVLAARDAASGAVAAVAAKFAALRGQLEQLEQTAETLRTARENVADFAERGAAALTATVDAARQFEDASLDVQQALAQQGAVGTAALERVQRAALAWSSTHVQGAEQYLAVSARMVSAYQSEARAQIATEAALRAATGARADAAGTGAALAMLYQSLGDKTRDFGAEQERLADIVAKTRAVYGAAFAAGELADPLKDAIPAAVAARVPIEQVVGAMGALNAAGIVGGEAGAGFAAAIEAMTAAQEPLGWQLERTKDGGVDLAQSLVSLRRQFGELEAMTPEVRTQLQGAFGPAWREISALLAQGQQLDDNLRAIGQSSGAARAAAQLVQDSDVGRLALYENSMTALKVALGAGVLPALTAMASAASRLAAPIADFVAAHPGVAKFVGVFGLLTVGLATVAAAGLSAAGAVVSMKIGLLTMAPQLAASIAATWAWTAALLANPMTWVVVGVVAAVAVIYKYWGPITEFFTGLWADIRGAFQTSWVDGILKLIELFSPVVWIAKGLNAVTEYLFGFSLFDAGQNIVRTVGDGIAAMASWPIAKMRAVVQKIRNMLPFSPAKEGPLRDLHRVKLMETLATAVRPASFVAAMRGATAAGMAAVATVPAPQSLPIPRAALGSLRASSGAGVSVGAVTIQIQGDPDKSVVEQLAAWVADPDNASALAGAVARDAQRRARAEYR